MPPTLDAIRSLVETVAVDSRDNQDHFTRNLLRALTDRWPDHGLASVDVEDADSAGLGHSDYSITVAVVLRRRWNPDQENDR